MQDFCNSAKHLYGEDELASARSARGWFDDHGYAHVRPVTNADLAQLRHARELIRAFLADRGDVPARDGLNELVRGILGPPMIDHTGALTFAATATTSTAAVLRPVLTALLTRSLTGHGARLKACAAPECRWIYFDRSPAAAGQWCAMNICGARHKMRAYRAREGTGHRAEDPAG